MTKPLSPRELRARIRAVFRRATAEPGGAIERFGNCELDLSRFGLRRDGRPLETTPTEIKHVWSSGVFVNDRVVDNHIGSLRKKIENDPAEPRHLVSVRGVG